MWLVLRKGRLVNKKIEYYSKCRHINKKDGLFIEKINFNKRMDTYRKYRSINKNVERNRIKKLNLNFFC